MGLPIGYRHPPCPPTPAIICSIHDEILQMVADIFEQSRKTARIRRANPARACGEEAPMPNRIVRDGMLESEAVLSLPPEGRWLYVSILLSADDYGLFEATTFKLAKKADIK